MCAFLMDTNIWDYPKIQGQKNGGKQSKVVDPSLNKGHAFKSSLGSKQRADAPKKVSQKHHSSPLALPFHITKVILGEKKVNSNKKMGKSKELKPNGRAITVSALYKARCTEYPFGLMFRWADKLLIKILIYF